MKIVQFFCFSLLIVSGMAQKLLYEPNAPDYKSNSASQSLFDKIAPDPSLSTFMDVLTQSSDIFNLLNHTDTDQNILFTVFCPVNSAFRNELDVYTRNHLIDFLKNHIVPNNKMDPDTLAEMDSFGTLLDGQKISVKYHMITKRIVLNDKAEVDTDHSVEAINGIAYKIDHLLRPTIAEQ
ncbi:unnamed protein product [Rhizopus stolonifer]